MLYRALDPRRTLQAFRHKTFRWWMVERVVGAETWAMRKVTRGWLIYNLTGSVLALAWMEALTAIIGVVVSPLAGVITDRIEKRLVMLACRVLLVLSNIGLGLVILLGSVQVWHIVAVTIVEALIYSVMEPSLQTLLAELVERDELLSATSTMFVVEGILSIIGAAVAGVIIEVAGAGWVFLANAPAFAVAAYALAQIPKLSVAAGLGSVRGDLAAGLRYLRASPVLLALLILAFARLAFAAPYNSFLAAFSQEDLGFDAAGLGLLTSAAGAGAFLSSLVIASMGDPKNKGWLLLASGAGAAVSVLALMGTNSGMAPFVFVVLAGIFTNAADVFTRTLMQTSCDLAYRGRVTSVAMTFSNLVTLLIIPAGVLADVYGVPVVVGALAALVVGIHIAAGALLPAIRQLS